MEVTVMIESYIRRKNGLVDIEADFQSINDYNVFSNYFGLKNQGAFAIKIFGLKYNKRIYSNRYYDLDLDYIKQNGKIQTITDSFLYGFELDFDEDEQHEFGNVFQNPSQSRLQQTNSPHTNAINIQSNLLQNAPIEIVVYDVGNGNWNEIRSQGEARVVYDIGASLNASKNEIQALVGRIVPSYCNLSVKPLLVISHWDKDHYHCLKALSDAEILHFDSMICVASPPTATAQFIYDRVKSLISVIVIHPKARQRGMPSLPDLLSRSGGLSIYACRQHPEINLSGLQLFVRSNDSNALLTGDCGWFQVNHILSNEAAFSNSNEKCNMVVPHHGSGRDSTYYGFVLPPTFMTGKCAAISVNKKKNSYGFPSNSLIKYLRTIFPQIEQTDKTGDIIMPL